MLKKRLQTSVVLAVIIISFVILSKHPFATPLFAAILSVLATSEIFSALKLRDNKPLYFLCIGLSAVIPMSPLAKYKAAVLFIFVSGILYFSFLMSNAKKKIEFSFHSVAAIFLSIIISVFYSTIKYLRALDQGLIIMATAMLICILTDTGGYLFGKCFGRHKLSPNLSPNKTVEGSIGGIAATLIIIIAAAIIRDNLSSVNIDYRFLICYLITSSVVAQFGDLAMSGIKRLTGIKDFGCILPGHGGVLDRFDSLMLVLPYTYIFLSYINPIFL